MASILIHGNKKPKQNTLETGSLAIEAALEISIFATVVFSLICVIQMIFVYAVTKNAAINTAEKISEYSCIFFKSGLSDVSESIKMKAINAVGAKDEGFTLIQELANVGIDMVESSVWESTAYKMMEDEIETELGKAGTKIFDIKLKTLLSSSFFLSGSEFTIYATTESDWLVPWFFGGKSFKTTAKVSANAWLYGAFSGYDVSEINVWSLNQLQRGRVLNEVFGGNLPQMFPTIDIMDKKMGRVTAIVSIDTTKKTYQDPLNYKKQILNEVRNLKAFTTATCDGVTVNESDYTSKRLLVITPENIQTEAQMQAGFEATMEAPPGVSIEFIAYQKSGA